MKKVSFGQRTCSSYVSFIVGRESREITLRNARKKIEALAHQLSLRRDRIEMAFHFFKVITIRNMRKWEIIFTKNTKK